MPIIVDLQIETLTKSLPTAADIERWCSGALQSPYDEATDNNEDPL
jgi:hypothetical protein